MRLYSIALAQAIQFEGKLGQKDVIGEWVPLSVLNESREHAYIEGDSAWMYGIVWEEVDNDLVLRHTTSREGRLVTVNLRDAEMVMEEFRRMARKMLVSREDFPPDGPVIVSEKTGRPYRAHHFRDTWRKLAGMAGLPKTVKNMDSRPKRGGGQDVDADIATELNQ
jgi:hypothetical protein